MHYLFRFFFGVGKHFVHPNNRWIQLLFSCRPSSSIRGRNTRNTGTKIQGYTRKNRNTQGKHRDAIQGRKECFLHPRKRSVSKCALVFRARFTKHSFPALLRVQRAQTRRKGTRSAQEFGRETTTHSGLRINRSVRMPLVEHGRTRRVSGAPVARR